MIFTKKNKNKRGTTLVELTIVLAIIAIIAVMTLTFTILVQKRVHLNTERDQLMMDLANIETLTKKWITHYDNQDYVLWLYEDDDSKWEKVDSNLKGKFNESDKSYVTGLIKPNNDQKTAPSGSGIAVQRLYTVDGEKDTLYTLLFSKENGLVAQWYPETDNEGNVQTRSYYSKYIEEIRFYTMYASRNSSNKRRITKLQITYLDPRTNTLDTVEMVFTTHAQASYS